MSIRFESSKRKTIPMRSEDLHLEQLGVDYSSDPHANETELVDQLDAHRQNNDAHTNANDDDPERLENVEVDESTSDLTPEPSEDLPKRVGLGRDYKGVQGANRARQPADKGYPRQRNRFR